MPNNKQYNQKPKQKMNMEFGKDTDVNEIMQEVQKAEAKKQQASGPFANYRQNQAANSMNAEFGSETDISQVQRQVQQAEAKKQQASGRYAKKQNQSDNY